MRSNTINRMDEEARAQGVVRVFEVDSMAEYVAKRLRPLIDQGEFGYLEAKGVGNVLTDDFMEEALQSAYDAITWQSVGTKNTIATSTDEHCTRELYRKVINSDGKARTASQLVFATFLGSSEATSAQALVVTDAGNSTTQIKLDASQPNGLMPGFRIGDLIRVEVGAGYEYREILTVDYVTHIITVTVAFSQIPAVGATVDQCLTEAAVLMIDNSVGADLANISAITSARAGTTGTVTVDNADGFTTGDFVRVRMADNGSQQVYEYGTIVKTGTSLAITFEYTGTRNFHATGTVQRGKAANHAYDLQYVKPENRSVVVETVITLTQV